MSLESRQEQALATVFYDGQCPLCRREIEHYRRLEGAGRVAWIDITVEPAELEASGLTRKQAIERFHVRDAHGNWHTGAWAFAELWRHLPAYRWLSRLLHALHLLPLLDRVYIRFARWRVRGRCDDASCSAE